MKEIRLSAGTIEYRDTGGDGPVLVLLHGLMMDATLWDDVIAGLSASHHRLARRHPRLPAAEPEGESRVVHHIV